MPLDAPCSPCLSSRRGAATRLDRMGRHLQGSRSFLHRYVAGGQPDNLAELASRSGVGAGGLGGVLRAELVAYDDERPPDGRSIDSASSFAAMFQTRLTSASVLAELGVEAPFGLEPTIYALSDRWQGVLAVVDRRLGTPPDVLQLEGAGAFCLSRSEWEPMLAWINQHLAPGDRVSLGGRFEPAIDALVASGANDSLPCTALRILRHAVGHGLERMEVWDSDPVGTNLWDVARDITPRPAPGASADEKVAYARLLGYADRPAEAAAILREVLTARPYHQLAARLEFSRLVGAHDWQGMLSLADEVLARPCSLELRIAALQWRCDARFTLQDVVGATADAAELEGLGKPWLAKVIRDPEAAWREVDVMNGVAVDTEEEEDDDDEEEEEDEEEDEDHRETSPMRPTTLTLGDGPDEGAHRLTIRVDEPTTRWGEVARHLARDLDDAKRAAAWDAGARLDLVGWAGSPREARFYLAGSVVHWVALVHAQIGVPLLSHVTLVLGQPVRAWSLDRRPLLNASYSQSVGGHWPFAIEGPTVARRLRLRAPALTGAELAGLVDLLRPAVRRGSWERGVLPREEGPELDGEEIVLPSPGLRAGAVLEVVHVWAQLFWVELEWIHWTS